MSGSSHFDGRVVGYETARLFDARSGDKHLARKDDAQGFCARWRETSENEELVEPYLRHRTETAALALDKSVFVQFLDKRRSGDSQTPCRFALIVPRDLDSLCNHTALAPLY